MSDSVQTPPSAPDAAEQHPPELMAPEVAEKADLRKDASTPADTPSINLKTLTDRTLHFLATASNETLGACLIGLGAGTYLVLGRVGLLLIGVMGGVVLHASWEGHVNSIGENKGQSQEARKRELGIDVVHRVLDWRDIAVKGNEKSSDDDSNMDVKLYSGKELDYSEFRPETAAALTELTDAVIRDYVKWWYSPILPTELSFPSACRQTLTAFLLSISAHLSRKRPADTFVDFVTNSSSIMIVFFNELSVALAATPGTSASEAIDAYLESKPESSLGNILDTQNQSKKLDMVAEDILQNYLDPKTYNCKPAQIFLRKVLAQLILDMTISTCSKPDWINGWIVYLLEDGEPDLINVIDAGVEGSSGQLENVKNAVEKQEKAVETEASLEEKRNVANHKRVVSRAQEAMDEAMREAQRLSQMIAEDDARRLKELRNTSSTTSNDDQSESTTQGIATPTSSQSETLADNDVTDLGISNIPSMASSQVGPPSPNMPEEPPKQEPKHSFTSFDQLVPSQPPTALMANPPPVEKPPPLTLHNSKMSIFDDSMPGEKAIIKNKPTAEYLIQIEPASQYHSGWMTARKFTDFETLHEVLRRIAAITGTTGFTEAHSTLPAWKGHTKASLRGELERYLNDAVRFKPLAESEGMKRFLEKETGLQKSSGGKGGFPGIGWPGQTFENMGKGMIDVLTKAPKEVAGGGKALFGGVTGVLGNVASPLGGNKKNRGDSVSNSPGTLSRSVTTPTPRHGRAESTVSELPSHIRTESTMSSLKRPSTDSLRNPNSPIIDQQPGREAPMERRPSYNPDGDGKRSGRSSIYGQSRSNSRAPSVRESMDLSPVMGGDQLMNLPPMPSDIPDDYTSSPVRSSLDPYHSRHPSRASTTSLPLPNEPVPPFPRRPSATSTTSSNPTKPQPKPTSPKSCPPLSEQETTVLVELFFAVINELYTLSSAWQIRRTLLNAAKTFLLRPGNPQLESIRQLISTTVLDDNTSDAGLAYHLRKIRENTLPTEDELKAWPKEMSGEEKERLKVKARKLLVEKGMPQALTSVMGQAASGEAVGKVFDCLQDRRVARGMVFGLLLQGMRAVTQ
ncbi:uncharacterized protein BDR25DRAFT_250928 [Lindgomyces ingoldianus]|uniref:Uncharacterized protein n=1 Tax=Lindgomyces ingoldianus TaxID=673940 RepID=A0ACB6RHN4_9PLEO|nr:uncharacterized protein BDR25DRAFT_250928 [Lindgomyces ingoldianus]KAF2478240.1 hypothetical protein BDR25DRAFT_250928 [Lindgomyces ingoldianus]